MKLYIELTLDGPAFDGLADVDEPALREVDRIMGRVRGKVKLQLLKCSSGLVEDSDVLVDIDGRTIGTVRLEKN